MQELGIGISNVHFFQYSIEPLYTSNRNSGMRSEFVTVMF